MTAPAATPTADRESLFVRIADWVSFKMGAPGNIIFWFVLVAAWFLIFATGLVGANSTFLPAWFVGQTFNFPLNLITTLAELFIGFLVAAAANRNERAADALAATQASLLASMDSLLASIKSEDDELVTGGRTLSQLLMENTDLTRQVKINTDLLEAIAVKVHVPTTSPDQG
jgi:hypothetical protein